MLRNWTDEGNKLGSLGHWKWCLIIFEIVKDFNYKFCSCKIWFVLVNFPRTGALLSMNENDCKTWEEGGAMTDYGKQYQFPVDLKES